jgi:hypothetical protein
MDINSGFQIEKNQTFCAGKLTRKHLLIYLMEKI